MLNRMVNPQFNNAAADRLLAATFHMMQASANIGAEVTTHNWPDLYLPVFSLAKAAELNSGLADALNKPADKEVATALAEGVEAVVLGGLPNSARRARVARSCGTTLVRGLTVGGELRSGIAIAVNDNVIARETEGAIAALGEATKTDVMWLRSGVTPIIVATMPPGNAVDIAHHAFRESLLPKGSEQILLELAPIEPQYTVEA